MGTIVEITAAGPLATAAVDAAFDAIMDIHRLMSFHELESDVSRINRAAAGEEIFVNPHTHRVLRFARRVSAACGGVFDVTVGESLVREGFLPREPLQEARFPQAAWRDEATWRDLVVLAGNRVWWRRPGRIDLGGIAKGYAVDQAIATLQMHGASSGLVNAGGDLRMFGEPQPVHVRLPDAPGMLAALGLFADCAVATSAAYFSSVDSDSGPLEPLVDRERRTCSARRGSATVIAAQCMTADALTKVVRLAPQLAETVLNSFDARAIVIDGTCQRSIGRTRCEGGSTS